MPGSLANMGTAERAGQHEKVTVDVIEDVLFIGPALTSAAKEPRFSIALQRVASNWVTYIENFDEAAGLVVLQSDLNDHVPTILKVRALTAIDAKPIVIADQPSAQHEKRLRHAGAIAVLTERHSFEDLLELIVRAKDRGLGEHNTSEAAGMRQFKLSDRELQVACLYAGHAAPSTAVVAQRIGIPVASARTYLQRARKVLSELGSTSTREQLRTVLIADGWMS